MPTLDSYPATYRAAEVRIICKAVQAGESVAVVGPSGAGKSKLLGLIAQSSSAAPIRAVLVDGNRLAAGTSEAVLQLMQRAVAQADPNLETAATPAAGAWDALNAALLRRRAELERSARAIYNNLRALRDAHKYDLAYVAAMRHLLPDDNELAELFFAHTIWLGPLVEADARWNVARFARRARLAWRAATVDVIVALPGGYPALLRAICEAHAAGEPLEPAGLRAHQAVQRGVAEFWSDAPSDAELRLHGLETVDLLMAARPVKFDLAALTAKEHHLLRYLQGRPFEVCE